jgi:hypothetical protein
MARFLKISIIAIGVIFLLYLFANTPLYFRIFSLNAGNNCIDFKRAPETVQVGFLMGCGCLTPELHDMTVLFRLDEQIENCFIERIRSCIGSEEIGEIYRRCVKDIMRTKYSNIDMNAEIDKWFDDFLDRMGFSEELEKKSRAMMKETYVNSYNKVMGKQ